ncbi:MAG: hypothetical protein AB1430_03335 [Pseudomonadota bacterium]
MKVFVWLSQVVAAIALGLPTVGGAAAAQDTRCTGLDCFSPPKRCEAVVCFRSREDERRFEEENHCLLGEQCGAQIYKTQTHCCGRDTSGRPRIIDKHMRAANPAFDWATYEQTCPNKAQNTAPPDALWQQCVAGRRHSPSDAYPVVLVEDNGSARDYCIDGCSTPPAAVNALHKAEIFLVPDKDNPSGVPSASFFNACSAHDRCYQSCNGGSRNDCDARLLADSLQACNTIAPNHQTTLTVFGIAHQVNTREKCVSAAQNMNTGLRLGGQKAFDLRRQQYCQCCP